MFASSSKSTPTPTPTPPPPAWNLQTYSLTSEDMGNTTLVDFWAQPRHAPAAYTVRTVAATRSRTFTTVTDAAGRTLATLEVRDMFSEDRVSIYDGAPVPFSTWMKGGLGPFHTTSVKPVARLGVLCDHVLRVLFPQVGVVSRRAAAEVHVEEYRCVA